MLEKPTPKRLMPTLLALAVLSLAGSVQAQKVPSDGADEQSKATPRRSSRAAGAQKKSSPTKGSDETTGEAENGQAGRRTKGKVKVDLASGDKRGGESRKGKGAPKPNNKPAWLTSPALQKKTPPWQWKYRWLIRGGFLGATAGVVVLIGRSAWEWGTKRSFKVQNDMWFQKREDLDGGADKFGHLVGMYLLSRGMTYIFDQTLCPHWISVLVGGVNSALLGLFIEVGDAYTALYGFSYSDIVFNLLGTALGVLQDSIPVLDRLFSVSMWWFPSQGYLHSKEKKQEAFTDYSGTKYFFHLLLSGVPYIRKTPLRYFRLDVAFWSRNFKPYDAGYPDNMHQYLYFGASVDFSRLVLDIWPDKWYRTSTAVFLKYFNIYGPFETGYKVKF